MVILQSGSTSIFIYDIYFEQVVISNPVLGTKLKQPVFFGTKKKTYEMTSDPAL